MRNGGEERSAGDQFVIERAVLTLLENKKISLGSTLSGVRSWIAFATTVLGYACEACLPPVCTVHVMMWLQCCRCPGTAQKYAGYLKLLVCKPQQQKAEAAEPAPSALEVLAMAAVYFAFAIGLVYLNNYILNNVFK